MTSVENWMTSVENWKTSAAMMHRLADRMDVKAIEYDKKGKADGDYLEPIVEFLEEMGMGRVCSECGAFTDKYIVGLDICHKCGEGRMDDIDEDDDEVYYTEYEGEF